MSDSRVKENMEVIGADGVHLGTVARVENHFIDLGLVADVEGTKVRLSANAAVAVTLEEEQPGKAI